MLPSKPWPAGRLTVVYLPMPRLCQPSRPCVVCVRVAIACEDLRLIFHVSFSPPPPKKKKFPFSCLCLRPRYGSYESPYESMCHLPGSYQIPQLVSISIMIGCTADSVLAIWRVSFSTAFRHEHKMAKLSSYGVLFQIDRGFSLCQSCGCLVSAYCQASSIIQTWL